MGPPLAELYEIRCFCGSCQLVCKSPPSTPCTDTVVWADFPHFWYRGLRFWSCLLSLLVASVEVHAPVGFFTWIYFFKPIWGFNLHTFLLLLSVVLCFVDLATRSWDGPQLHVPVTVIANLMSCLLHLFANLVSDISTIGRWSLGSFEALAQWVSPCFFMVWVASRRLKPSSSEKAAASHCGIFEPQRAALCSMDFLTMT